MERNAKGHIIKMSMIEWHDMFHKPNDPTGLFAGCVFCIKEQKRYIRLLRLFQRWFGRLK